VDPKETYRKKEEPWGKGLICGKRKKLKTHMGVTLIYLLYLLF
jgi:hypothetical protein